MSSLSNFCKGKVENEPNKVHNIPDAQPARTGEVLTKNADRYRAALDSGKVRPMLYYSEEEQLPVHGKLEEPPHAVESRLQDREEFPYG